LQQVRLETLMDTEERAGADSALVPSARGRGSEGPVSFRLSPLVVTESEPRGSAAEAINALRVHLMARHIQQGHRSIAVCETGNSGGLFVAMNLAVSFAESGLRTLLVETNLRRPRLAEFITPSRNVTGLAELIDDPNLPISAAVQQVNRNLSVMYGGDAQDRPQQLLASNRFATICDLCMRDFDITIATTPPANYYSDARRVASLLRHVAIVARRDTTYVKDIKAMMTELQSDGARVIGTIYNDF
jgi:protein-tyrosine kinase